MARLVHTNAYGIITNENPDPKPSEVKSLVPKEPTAALLHPGSNGQSSGPVLHHSSLSPEVKPISNKKAAKLQKQQQLNQPSTSSTSNLNNRPQIRNPPQPRTKPNLLNKKKPFLKSQRNNYRQPVRGGGDNEPYEYNRYHSRGAIALNGFDAKQRGLRYNWRDGSMLLPKWEQIMRKSMYIFQLMIIVTAGIMVGGTIMAERNGWDFTPLIFGQMEEELIYVPFIGGAFAALTAFVGCVGAKTRDKCGRVMLLIYNIMLAISLALGVASCAQAMADKSNVWQYAERQWNAMTYVEEQIFEWDHFCCNFDKLDPCCRFTYGEGECVNEYICFERVKPHLIDQFNIIIACSAVHSVYMFVVFLMSITLYTGLSLKDKLDKDKENDGTKERVEDSITKSATTTNVRSTTRTQTATATTTTTVPKMNGKRKVRTTKRANPIR